MSHGLVVSSLYTLLDSPSSHRARSGGGWMNQLFLAACVSIKGVHAYSLRHDGLPRRAGSLPNVENSGGNNCS